jgi:hypothetical protein
LPRPDSVGREHTFVMRAQEEVDEVLTLIATSLSDAEIARRTGVARRTVLDWRHGRVSSQRPGRDSCGVHHDPLELPAATYAYLLGIRDTHRPGGRCHATGRCRTPRRVHRTEAIVVGVGGPEVARTVACGPRRIVWSARHGRG